MKINCPQCRKKSAASIHERTHEGGKTVYLENRCDNCRYLWDSWEKPIDHKDYQKDTETYYQLIAQKLSLQYCLDKQQRYLCE